MIRDMTPQDVDAIKDIHKGQGFDYNLPEITSPLLLVKKVREVDGRVVAAMFLRVTAEAFLLVQGSPEAKGRAIEELQPAVLRDAWEKGLSDIICVVPPEISESFGPVLARGGWYKVRDWPLYQRDLEGA